MRPLSLALLLAITCRPATTLALAPPRPDADPRIAALATSVSEARLQRLVETLAGFGTRHTLSDPAATTRGIGAAQRWIFDELRRSSLKLQVSYDTHKLARQGRITRPVDLRNIIAVLPGKSSRRIYITAHYDTVSVGPQGQISPITRPAGAAPATDPQLRADQDYDVDAPGANDNGSGTALTMELARVFAESNIDFDATLVFALWAGEEQGLFGAKAHAENLDPEIPIEAVFNNDIVGNSRGGDGVVDAETVRVYSEGPEDSMSRALARHVARIGARYLPAHRIRLMARADRFNRGSDHSAFNQLGVPAVVFREANENFAKQHAASDTVDGVDFRYLARNTRVNAASAASLALAPAAPTTTNERGQLTIGREPSGYDASLRWNPPAGAVAYRIYWRDTWTNDWQHAQLIGNVTEFVLPGVSIDDYVFGVAAVGADGHESLVSAYVPAARQDPEVQLVQP